MLLKSLLLLLISVSLSSYAQTPQFPEENPVESSSIIVINKLQKIYASGSQVQLVKAFGKAKVEKEADEVLGGFAYTYKYPGFEVYFNEKSWEAMTVSGPEYHILLNSKAYTVGDPISKVKAAFPLSYKNRRDKDRFIRLGITSKKVMSDAYVAITYNAKGIITSIAVANDNS
jgi:hypothetical protein